MALPTRSKLIILTAVLASLLEIIDTSIVNVAIPTMMGNLGATLDEISWVITGYIIANAIVLPIASWMSQQLGRKFYYTACIVIFTAASVACGLAPNLEVLVIFRVIQGFAGGALLPTSQALIYESFPPEQAGMASAIYGMSVMIGPTLGPTLGGYLTDNAGWRSIFNINLPIGIVVAILSYLLIEDVGFDPNKAKEQAQEQNSNEKSKEKSKIRKIFKPREQRRPVDSIGLSLLIVGVGCLQYMLERGHADDWFASTAIVITAILAVTCLVALIWWELRAPHPILELHHFKNATFRSGVMLMSAVGVMLYSIIFMIPIFVTTILGLTATQTGELFIPGALAAAFAMPFIGKTLRKTDPRVHISTGILLLFSAVLLMSRFDSQTSVSGMFFALLIRGVAMAFLFVPINSTVLSQFQGAAIGQAAGMLNLCRQLGGSVGIALMSTLFQESQVRAFGVLSTHLTWFDPTAVQTYFGMIGAFKSKLQMAIGMAGDSSLAAIKLLTYRTEKEAFVLAYQHVLKLASVLLLLALIPTALMKTKKTGKGPVLDAH